MYGYMGKILNVDLTKGTFQEMALDTELAERYLGGAGLGTYLLYKELDIRCNPLGPGNILCFLTGPLTATKFPTAVRYEVCTRSPLTNAWLDSSSSGLWGRRLKQTGYDGVIVRGISSFPVSLVIDESGAKLIDAEGLWGKDTFETQTLLKDKVGSKNSSVACIGPSGEKLVLLANIMNDDGRSAGRGGAGAVMGSKRLKAILVKGDKQVNLASPSRFVEIVRKTNAILRESSAMIQRKKYGTAGSLDINWALGSIPVKNWQVGQWKEGCVSIGGEKMANTILRPHAGCFGCPVNCSRWIKIENGEYQMEGPGPEYETLCAFGTLCQNDDLESICWANDLCNRFGIDTISTGASIAFAIEAYEKGLINEEDTGGIKLTWGNKKAIIELVELIGRKEGFGELLGQGTKRASEKIGGISQELVTHVKGMEAPMHDPRAFFSMAGSYATSPRGACHLHGAPMMFESGCTLPEGGIMESLDRHSNEGKGRLVMVAQDLSSVINSSVFCFLIAFFMLPNTLKILSEAINATCSFAYSPEELLNIGERITNLQHAFNLRLGFGRKDDYLPQRLLKPVSDGPNAGKSPDLNFILDDYYQIRGWDKSGLPTRQKLLQLGLDYVAEDLGIS
jgi:aldehyde:ferredoxin oxidoreductase